MLLSALISNTCNAPNNPNSKAESKSTEENPQGQKYTLVPRNYKNTVMANNINES
jgi:hypothetical protein